MRVLNSLIDPRIGGPQLRALTVANQLLNHDIETVFLLPEGSNVFENMATDAGFEVIRPNLPRLRPPKEIIENTRFVLYFYPAVQRICSVFQEEDIDIVHASMTLNFQAVVAAQRASVPLAWFFNDTGTPWPINRITAQMAQSMADEIAVAADAVHEYFFSTSVPSKTVYPPVDTDTFDPETVTSDDQTVREEFGIDEDIPLVGTVGNVNPIKGHKTLLRSIARVKNQIGPVAVPVVGKILDTQRGYFTELKRLRSRLNLGGTVRFIGHRSDIPRLLSSFDVFVLPSNKEACPIAVLEAMSMKKAIVATSVGGIPEQIVDGEHGWLVPPQDPDRFANAICDALSKPSERRRRGNAARKRAENLFSIDQCVERHVEMYNTALNS